MRQGSLILAAGRVCSNKKRKQNTKSRRTQNTPRNPQQPGDHDHFETTCDETLPRISPYSPASIDPGFVEIGIVQLRNQ